MTQVFDKSMKTGAGMTMYSDGNTYEADTADGPHLNILGSNKTLLSDHEREMSSQASPPRDGHQRPCTADVSNRIRKIATDSVFKKWGFHNPSNLVKDLNMTSTSF